MIATASMGRPEGISVDSIWCEAEIKVDELDSGE